MNVDQATLDARLSAWAASQLPDRAEWTRIRAAILAGGHAPNLPSNPSWWLDLSARTNAIIARAMRSPLPRLPAWG